MLYDSSGNDEPSPVAGKYDVPTLPVSGPLRYAKVTPFIVDLFEWAADQDYDYLVNLESDLAFVRPGFTEFLARVMPGVDHLAPRFARPTPPTSRWRPYRSLRPELPELPELFGILGIDHTNECFSPAQVFSKRYADRVLDIHDYRPGRGAERALTAPASTCRRSFVTFVESVDNAVT